MIIFYWIPIIYFTKPWLSCSLSLLCFLIKINEISFLFTQPLFCFKSAGLLLIVLRVFKWEYFSKINTKNLGKSAVVILSCLNWISAWYATHEFFTSNCSLKFSSNRFCQLVFKIKLCPSIMTLPDAQPQITHSTIQTVNNSMHFTTLSRTPQDCIWYKLKACVAKKN